MTKALEAKSLGWKDSSLKVISTEGPLGDMVTNGEKKQHVRQEVDRMEVLGVMLDSNGSTATSIAHRAGIVDGGGPQEPKGTHTEGQGSRKTKHMDENHRCLCHARMSHLASDT